LQIITPNFLPAPVYKDFASGLHFAKRHVLKYRRTGF
jgi:hypothetical protein